MNHVTCRLTAKNRDQLWNLRSVIEYGLPFLFFVSIQQHIVAKPPRDVGAGAVAVMC